MAKDDPVVGAKAICTEVVKKNPYLLLGVTERGGHVGFF